MRFPRLFVLVVIGVLLAPLNALADGPVKIVVLGDSLVAGYGLAAGRDFPARLEAALRAGGKDVSVVNAGVTGDTASGGLSRFERYVPEDASGLILELGINDAMRRIDPQKTERALRGILDKAKERGMAVLIAGMVAPGSSGKDYAARFDPIFGRLAEDYGTLLYPFFLDGVADEPELKLADGIHPNPEGVEVLVKGILPQAEDLVERAEAAQ
ncbi:acyl-CoA thioesterase-1 [Rhodobium orientis]|uniref:Arylesterase n=1 Tax=Rhodobium orientis TaxID=34017 RepID=A0A327JK46_9HYPH|nr:arylesterase [Rhodobium orientis]MBB4305169.1 acyl-CoA thioesterase-1 [Rhodobium orientis]MBK5949241.1 arylesterase [Rhodobium orientis]RAI26657.1 arylesterase [Rhodobium orientis]